MSEQTEQAKPRPRRTRWIPLVAIVLAAAGWFAYPFIRYSGHESPIEWMSYEKGLELAHETGKPLLIDIEAKW